MEALTIKLEDDETIRLQSLIETNQEYLSLYNELGLSFGKLETMTAIEEC